MEQWSTNLIASHIIPQQLEHLGTSECAVKGQLEACVVVYLGQSLEASGLLYPSLELECNDEQRSADKSSMI